MLTSVFAFCFGIFFVRVDLGFLGGGGSIIREQINRSIEWKVIQEICVLFNPKKINSLKVNEVFNIQYLSMSANNRVL